LNYFYSGVYHQRRLHVHYLNDCFTGTLAPAAPVTCSMRFVVFFVLLLSVMTLLVWPLLPSRQMPIQFCPKFLLHQHSSSQIHHHIHLNRDIPCSIPLPGLSFSNFLTVLSPFILTRHSSHSNLRHLITVIMHADLNFINL
jgi:hypothetical protein